MRHRSLSRLLIPVLLSLIACTTTPLSERYAMLDGEAKASFLAYYPLLTPRQRDVWLGISPDADDKLATFKAREGDDPDFGALLKRFPRDPGKLASYVPVSLRVTANGAAPIVAGDSIALKAEVQYRDASKADATEDVHWRVEPALARMSGNRLEFGCVHSDVEVAANFLGERSGSVILRLRKPLRELKVDIADRWKGINESRELQLKSQARCTDGTSQDVSCQSDWQMDPVPGLELRGCGRLVVVGETLTGQSIRVRASYGGKTGELRVKVP